MIAQVHGYCLAGGSELATACDLVYVAEDARIGYPPVRLMSPPDMQFHPWLVGMRRAMEAMLGARAAMRAGTELQALAFTTEASRAYMQQFRRDGKSVGEALSRRDAQFGDYREREKK